MAGDQSILNQAEIWKPVVGHEGSYEVSDHGRVRSLPRVIHKSDGTHQTLKGRVLRPTPHGAGYYHVAIGQAGKKLIHHLVLEAFVGPRPEGADGCHYDDVRTNNNLENLRWDTRKGNLADSIRNGNNPRVNQVTCKRGHVLDGGNLRPYTTRTSGHRNCLACARAHSRCWRKKHLTPFIQDLSDAYYMVILGDEPKSHVDHVISDLESRLWGMGQTVCTGGSL